MTIRKNHLKQLATNLRKAMTDEERKLWYNFLKNQKLHFRRQAVFGKYIVDFYCASKKLVIEIDGSQHYEDSGIERDSLRDDYLSSCGLTVLRYSNLDVNTRFKDVCEDIWNNLQ